MNKIILTFLSLFISTIIADAQLPDSCKIDIGINISGVFDYSTEVPFANVMKMSRPWYTKGVNDPSYAFATNYEDALTYDADGYPTHIPQVVTGEPLLQDVATIWDGMDAWPTGKYTLLWDGTGDFTVWGSMSNLIKVNTNRYEFDVTNPVGGVLEIRMILSDASDPIQNMRLLLPGTESTYQAQPFNQEWLDGLAPFSTVRFMDWGHTNNWGQTDAGWDNPTLATWSERAQLDYYTYSSRKGVPYEVMIQLINHLDVDGWVCIPHRASNDYIMQMANMFRDQVEPERQLYVEYSNEIWNWIFGQTHWLNEYGCVSQNISWPEGLVPYIQNALDLWSGSFTNEMDRITRVVGVQTGWLDVSERICYNMAPNSIDAISPTFYFGFEEQDEITLDNLGSNATVTDVANFARAGMDDNFGWMQDMKTISDSLNLPLAFYEGGQHLTPTPFGVMPTYATALLDVQTDPVMYDMYTEWIDSVRTLNTTDEPMLLCHFVFASKQSPQYGSWGLLERSDQDTSIMAAPKYQAFIEADGCDDFINSSSDLFLEVDALTLYPNPTTGFFKIEGVTSLYAIQVLDVLGNVHQDLSPAIDQDIEIDLSNLPVGMYFVSVRLLSNNAVWIEKIIKN